jgi:hypothetical protein
MDASDVPAALLFDRSTTSTSPSLLIVLIPIAIIIAVGTFLPMGAAARTFGGLLILGGRRTIRVPAT